MAKILRIQKQYMEEIKRDIEDFFTLDELLNLSSAEIFEKAIQEDVNTGYMSGYPKIFDDELRFRISHFLPMTAKVFKEIPEQLTIALENDDIWQIDTNIRAYFLLEVIEKIKRDIDNNEF